MTDQLKSVLESWCACTGQIVKYPAVERLLFEFVKMDFTVEDLECVVRGMKRHNTRSDSKYKIQLHKVIGDLETFASMLAEFQAKERNLIKAATPAQKVVENFRNTKTETANTPAKSIGQLFRELP